MFYVFSSILGLSHFNLIPFYNIEPHRISQRTHIASFEVQLSLFFIMSVLQHFITMIGLRMDMV